ncbi:hypothetical protein ACQ86D_17250 [Streptomyces galilaeus]
MTAVTDQDHTDEMDHADHVGRADNGRDADAKDERPENPLP